MAKSDLKARPIFHRTHDAIDAHLTIVFAALAIARDLQNLTSMSIKKIVQTLRRIHTVIVDIDGPPLTARTPLDDHAETIIAEINARH